MRDLDKLHILDKSSYEYKEFCNSINVITKDKNDIWLSGVVESEKMKCKNEEDEKKLTNFNTYIAEERKSHVLKKKEMLEKVIAGLRIKYTNIDEVVLEMINYMNDIDGISFCRIFKDDDYNICGGINYIYKYSHSMDGVFYDTHYIVINRDKLDGVCVKVINEYIDQRLFDDIDFVCNKR